MALSTLRSTLHPKMMEKLLLVKTPKKVFVMINAYDSLHVFEHITIHLINLAENVREEKIKHIRSHLVECLKIMLNQAY